MKHKLKVLHIVTALSIVLYIGVGFWFCGTGNECTDAGIVLAPIFIPSLLLVPATIIVDLVVLGRKLVPGHERLVSGGVLCAIVVILILAYAIFERHQYYPSDKALSLIRNCKVSDVNYDGTDPMYIYPLPSINGKDQLKVHKSEHARFLQTLKDYASTCKYNIQPNAGGFSASSF
jgi:hypothetical protein